MKLRNFIYRIKITLFELFLKFRGLFVQTPTRKLSWTVDDFKTAKKWSKSRKHPYLKFKTLWDFCEDRYDSVYTIQNVNNFIKI